MQINSNVKSTITERILNYLEIKGVTPYRFCKDLGLSNGFLDKPREISTDKYANILVYFPEINPNWLLTGEGGMLKPEKPRPIIQSERRLIPFYDAEAEAGTFQQSSMEPIVEPVEWIDAGDWFRDADSAMRVHGDSMFPEYKSGSIVAMKEVYNKQLIVYGEDYVIQTSEYRIIKRLQRASKAGFWLMCSVNEETWEKGELAGRLIHEPFEIQIDDVIKIFRVLGCVKRNESSRIVYNK